MIEFPWARALREKNEYDSKMESLYHAQITNIPVVAQLNPQNQLMVGYSMFCPCCGKPIYSPPTGFISGTLGTLGL